MSLIYIQYLIPIILFILGLIYFFSTFERKYFNWVKDHWFYQRSSASKVSSTLFYLGIFIMLISVLDLRGPEEKIEAEVSKQETMILIDSSASMLAEDVRPNRFRKAILLAKHYVKKAVGQHISVTVFSDDQKKIIPYTNDVDLLEARLTGLESLDLTRGGTGLKLALQESVAALKSKDESVKGNILVITDAENNSEFGVINIQEDINVAIVGVGTVKGGVIPLRDKKGNFKRNKKHKGKEVITKLDEDFLKKLSSKIKNFKYWTASSYSLPTEEILDFFKANEEALKNKDSVRIRPVLANYLILPAVILIILSYLLKNFKTFIIPMLLITTSVSYAKEKEIKVEEPEKVKSSIVLDLENRLKKGTITDIEKRKLANELLKEKFSKESSKLYKEIIKSDVNENNKEDYFNLGASELQNKDSRSGLSINKRLYDYLEQNDPDSELLKKTKENMLKAIVQQQKQEQKKKEEKKKDKEKKEDKDSKEKKEGDKKEDKSNKDKKKGEKSEDQKEGSKGDKSDEKGDSSDQKNKGDPKKDENKKDDEKEKGDDDKNGDEKNKDEFKKENDIDSKKDSDSKLSKSERKKLPALLKQLMNDDNQLQRKVIDAATTKRGSVKKKDW